MEGAKKAGALVALILAAAWFLPWEVEAAAALINELALAGKASLSEYLFYETKNPLYLTLNLTRLHPAAILPTLGAALLGKTLAALFWCALFLFTLYHLARTFELFEAAEEGRSAGMTQGAITLGRSFLLTSPFLFGSGGLFYIWLALLALLLVLRRGSWPLLAIALSLIGLTYLPALLPALFLAAFCGRSAGEPPFRVGLPLALGLGLLLGLLLVFLAAHGVEFHTSNLPALAKLPFTLETLRAEVLNEDFALGILDNIADRTAAWGAALAAIAWNIFDLVKRRAKADFLYWVLPLLVGAEVFWMRGALLAFLYGALVLSALWPLLHHFLAEKAPPESSPNPTQNSALEGSSGSSYQLTAAGLIAALFFAAALITKEPCRNADSSARSSIQWVVSYEDLAHLQACPANLARLHLLDLKIIPYNVEKLTTGLAWPDEEPVFKPHAVAFLEAEKRYAEGKITELSSLPFQIFLKSRLHPSSETRPYRRVYSLWHTLGADADYRRSLILQ